MATVNENFLKMANNYLFADIAKKVEAYKAAHAQADIISLGIGDVTQPLCRAVVEALIKAADEMGTCQGFHGYGPEHGYDFLRRAILQNDFTQRGIDLKMDEIFVSDGAKSDTGNIQELIDLDCSICLSDPVYPVYLDSNIMSGRTGEKDSEGKWSNVVYLPGNAGNGFVPQAPQRKVDVVYLCFPNNPTGAVATRGQLKQWVDYALANDTLIFFDAAYEAFIQDDDIPHSIYEIEGARKCAIEFHSFSKTAGFTGLRCGYTVVPHEVTASTATGRRVELNPLWNRRQCTKFNGTSYLSQRAAEATYTPEGKAQTREAIKYYMGNAKIILDKFRSLGFEVWGGRNAPYVWVRTAGGTDSWQFFEQMLSGAQVVCTPGVGFGPSGEGYVRLTAFNSREKTTEAMERIEKWLKNK